MRSAPPDWFGRGIGNIWLPYTQMKTAGDPLPVARTQGSRIYLADGRELIDGIASWWTACHGYNHPHIRAAVSEQFARMPHVMFGGLVHEPALNLARRLVGLLPEGLSHVFFCDSGSVAVEVAMKMAVQFWLNKGITQRCRFVAFKGGYHGDTFATCRSAIQRKECTASSPKSCRNKSSRSFRPMRIKRGLSMLC